MNKLFYFSDEDVQSQLATKYNLLVHIGSQTFQYAVVDTVHEKIKILAEFEIPKGRNLNDLIQSVEELPESSRLFKFSFNAIKISFETSDYTFIPQELYQEDILEDYGKYLTQNGDNEILVISLKSAEIKNVVAIDSQFISSLNRIFYKPKIYNQSIPFIEGVQKLLKREDEEVLFVDVQPTSFQAAFYKDFKLEFYNSFEYENADEFNYYLLNLIKSQNIVLEKTPIILSGKVSSNDRLYQRIEKYFETIGFVEIDFLNKNTDGLENVDSHTFFTLFSLQLCV